MRNRKCRSCIVCGKKYPTTKLSHNFSHINYRGKDMITCSPKCSKIYNRIATRISFNLRQRLKKEKILIYLTKGL